MKLFRSKNREVHLNGEINDSSASVVIAKLLDLFNKDNDKEIKLIVDSPGGSVTAAFAIYDVMRYIKCEISIMVAGEAHGMAAFLVAAGSKGKRTSLKNSLFGLIPFSKGKNDSVEFKQEELIGKVKEKVYSIFSEDTKQGLEKVRSDFQKETFLNPDEAIRYGIIDRIE